MSLLIVLFLTLYLTYADRYLGAAGLLPIDPTTLYVMGSAGLVGANIWAKAPVANFKSPAVLPALTLALIGITDLIWWLFLGADPALKISAFLRLFDAWVFMSGIFLGWVLLNRGQFHRPLWLAFSLLAATIVIDAFLPGTFSRFYSRAAGLAENPNTAAFFLLLLAASLLDYGKLGRKNGLLLGVAALAVFLTMSRAGLLGLGLLLTVFVISLRRDIKLLSKGMAFLAVGTVATVVLIGFLTSNLELFSHPTTNSRLTMITNPGSFVQQDDTRLVLFREYVGLIAERPWIGHGTGHTAFRGHGPHNIYLEAWFSKGLFGLGLVLFFLFSLFFIFLQRRFFPGVAVSLIVVVQGLFSHTLLDQRPFLLVTALLLVYSSFPRERPATPWMMRPLDNA